jgi:amidohydrolase
MVESSQKSPIALRHRLHQIAELSGEEAHTARTILEYLTTFQPSVVWEQLGGHGLAFGWKGALPGPKVLFRAELDALPIGDPPGWAHGSVHPDRGHKCGHDGHMAILATLAEKFRNGVEKGEVWLVFQPAEETGQGAKRVMEDSRMQALMPDVVLALHNLPGYPLHQVVVRPGTFTKASTGLICRLKGITSHASEPEKGLSPASLISDLLGTIPSLPSALFGQQDEAIITIVHARLGQPNFGVSPGEAVLMCTLRAETDEKLSALGQYLRGHIQQKAQLYPLEVTFEETEYFSATHNDPEVVAWAKEAASQQGLAIMEKEGPFAWSEDFGLFTQKFPGLMLGLGAGEHTPPLHHPQYDFPDDLITTGASLFYAIYTTILSKS